MGERVLMVVVCPPDKAEITFWQKLGFTKTKTDPLALGPKKGKGVVLVDKQANYGHFGELPNNRKYVAVSERSENYLPTLTACDGKNYHDMIAVFDTDDYRPVILIGIDGRIDQREVADTRAAMRFINTVAVSLGMKPFFKMTTRSSREFTTRREAEVFKEGMEYVNDAAITDIQIEEVKGGWAVTFIDVDSYEEDELHEL